MIALTTKGNELIPLINRSASRGSLNNRAVIFGDGSVVAADQTAPYFGQNNPVTTGMVQALGKLIWAGNLSTTGDTTALLLARLGTDILAMVPLPQKVIIWAGIQDIVNSVAVATTIANITSMVSQMQTVGIQPIMMGLPAVDTTAYHLKISQLNVLLRSLAETTGIIFVDNHRVTAAADGTATYGAVSSLYPTNASAVAMGVALAAAVNASGGTLSLTPWGPTTSASTTAGNGVNLLQNGIFQGSFSGTTPANWTTGTNSASSTTASAASPITADNLVGKWWTIVKTDATNSHYNDWYQDIAIGASLAVGDKVAFSARLIYTEATVSTTAVIGFSIEANFVGATTARTIGLTNWSRTCSGMFYGETTVPAGTTSVRVQVSFRNGTGTLQVGQIGMVNLTALGL